MNILKFREKTQLHAKFKDEINVLANIFIIAFTSILKYFLKHIDELLLIFKSQNKYKIFLN